MQKLRELAASWMHERDRGYYIGKDGAIERIWDAGCHKMCRRCQLEKALEEMEAPEAIHKTK